jgi:hypothetical protein
MALWMVAFVGARPIIGPLNGGIADLTSVSAALLFSAGVVLVASLLPGCRERPVTAEQAAVP